MRRHIGTTHPALFRLNTATKQVCRPEAMLFRVTHAGDRDCLRGCWPQRRQTEIIRHRAAGVGCQKADCRWRGERIFFQPTRNGWRMRASFFFMCLGSSGNRVSLPEQGSFSSILPTEVDIGYHPSAVGDPTTASICALGLEPRTLHGKISCAR